MKKVICFLMIFLVTGCFSSKEKNDNINTIIEEEKNMLVAINYPITNIKKLDSIIQNDIEDIYNNFKKDYTNFNNLDEQSELNIDYDYEKIDDYINIKLKVFINSSVLAHPYNYIKTYVYDTKSNKIVMFDDLLDKKNKTIFTNYIKKELLNKYKECILLDEFKSTVTNNYNYPLFTFNYDFITVYFNPANITASYCNIISAKVPITKLKLNTKISKKTTDDIKVSIEKKNKIINPDKKVIALTFDDGPSKYTNKILEILKENDVVATFFVIGNKANMYKETLQKMVKNGNEIGNHSYNHKSLTKLDKDELIDQINKTQEIIKNITGFYPTYLRPTYGAVNNKIRTSIDMNIVLWNIDTKDWKYKSVNTIVKRAMKATDLDIILMHDTKDRTVQALKKIIPQLKDEGYEFVTISELNEVKLLRQKLNNKSTN